MLKNKEKNYIQKAAEENKFEEVFFKTLKGLLRKRHNVKIYDGTSSNKEISLEEHISRVKFETSDIMIRFFFKVNGFTDFQDFHLSLKSVNLSDNSRNAGRHYKAVGSGSINYKNEQDHILIDTHEFKESLNSKFKVNVIFDKKYDKYYTLTPRELFNQIASEILLEPERRVVSKEEFEIGLFKDHLSGQKHPNQLPAEGFLKRKTFIKRPSHSFSSLPQLVKFLLESFEGMVEEVVRERLASVSAKDYKQYKQALENYILSHGQKYRFLKKITETNIGCMCWSKPLVLVDGFEKAIIDEMKITYNLLDKEFVEIYSVNNSLKEVFEHLKKKGQEDILRRLEMIKKLYTKKDGVIIDKVAIVEFSKGKCYIGGKDGSKYKKLADLPSRTTYYVSIKFYNEVDIKFLKQ